MAFDVTFTLIDAFSRDSRKTFESTQATLADAITAEAALWTDFAALSDAGRIATTYSQSQAETDAAAVGSNVRAQGVLHVRLNDGAVYSLVIPGISLDVINPDGSIDITAAAVTDFVANFEQAGPFRLGRGRYVVDILYGEFDPS